MTASNVHIIEFAYIIRDKNKLEVNQGWPILDKANKHMTTIVHELHPYTSANVDSISILPNKHPETLKTTLISTHIHMKRKRQSSVY